MDNGQQEFRRTASDNAGHRPTMSDTVRQFPTMSDDNGGVRTQSDSGGTSPNMVERKESHTLSVKEVARMFEQAGVARTERSVIRWCQPNRQGVAILDAYFDPNERRYFITPQSVERAIKEEQHRMQKLVNGQINAEVGQGPTLPEQGNEQSRHERDEPDKDEKAKAMQQEIMDLKIMNKGKDLIIDQLKSERAEFFNQLLDSSRKVGELETKLLQLSGPKENPT